MIGHGTTSKVTTTGVYSTRHIETKRLTVQRQLDLGRAQAERNRRGQFATPVALADEILQCARAHFGTQAVRFLDPAIGTGAFYSALLRAWPACDIACATGFEIDPYYGEPGRTLWRGTPLQLRLADFTLAIAPKCEPARYNLIICNPPYVRHHHLAPALKRRLQRRCVLAADVHMSGLAGLYAYFLALTQPWMMPGALAGWLIPGDFMHVNYGHALQRYLLERVTLLRVHRFDPAEVQFDDALVSSAVVWFRNAAPRSQQQVEFTVGGSLSHPRARSYLWATQLKGAKWNALHSLPAAAAFTHTSASRALGDFFRIKRGIATGANDFFIMTLEQARARAIPTPYLRPILPRPIHLEMDEVLGDAQGRPMLPQPLLLLDCPLNEAQIRARHPEFWRYLETGVGQVARRYLCSRRSPWYSQEARESTLFLCSYIARQRGNGRLHRFIFNRSVAVAANSYLMLYPRDILTQFIDGDIARARAVWQALCDIEPEALKRAGRVYGGGMYKIEPKELTRVLAPGLTALLRGRTIGSVKGSPGERST